MRAKHIFLKTSIFCFLFSFPLLLTKEKAKHRQRDLRNITVFGRQKRNVAARGQSCGALSPMSREGRDCVSSQFRWLSQTETSFVLHIFLEASVPFSFPFFLFDSFFFEHGRHMRMCHAHPSSAFTETQSRSKYF